MNHCKLEDIEQISEQYELFRSTERCGPQSITDFLTAFDLGNPEARLVSELVQIDIQLNWMSWDKQVSNLVNCLSPAEICSRLERIPRLHDYRQLVQGDQGTLEFSAFQAAAQCEFESRNSWGDAIGVPFYNAVYGLDLTPDRYHRPCRLNYTVDGSSLGRDMVTFDLRGKTVIGRQRRNDEKSLFSEQLAWGDRIVIAEHAETRISREQLAVQLLNRQFAVLTNLSTLNPVSIANTNAIAPGQSTVLSFDFSVRLPCRRLHFSALMHQ